MSRTFSFAVLLLLMIWTVDGLFLQAQMGLLHSTPLPNLLIKVSLTLLIFGGAMAKVMFGPPRAVPRPFWVLWFGFFVYLLIEALVLILRFGYPTEYVLLSFNAYYYALLLLPFLFGFRETLPESLISKTLLFFFFPLSFLGLAQHYSGNLLLPTDSPNGYLQVFSWDFFGSVRAFSLFTSPSNFGHFIALIAGLGLALCLSRSGNEKRGIVLIVLGVFSGYSTLTRATQLEIVFVLFTVWLLYRRSSHQTFVLILPFVYGVLGSLVAFVAPIVFIDLSGDNFLSNWSIFERYLEWAKYGSLWLDHGLLTILFGAGIAQNDRLQPGQDVIVDSSFLGIGVHIGIFGLVLWVVITWRLWKFLLSEIKKRSSPLRVAATGAWSVLFFTSVFNISVFYLLPFVLFLMTNPEGKTQKCSRLSASVQSGSGRKVAEVSGIPSTVTSAGRAQ